MKKIIALYPGSFDPMTLGHFDVIERAAHIFDELIVGVGFNTTKSGLIPIVDRVKLIEEVLRKFANVRVKSFSDLTVTFAKKFDVKVIVRGLRNEGDFTFELQMAHMNRVLENAIESVFIPTRSEFSHISSSLVREIHGFRGDLESLVPKPISRYLKAKS